MPTTYIVYIDYNYPLNFVKDKNLAANSIIKVKRQVSLEEVNKELSCKIFFANNLKNKNIIRIQSIQQSSKALQISYQYIQLQKIQNNSQYGETVLLQIENLISYLINVGLKTNLSVEKMGITKQGIMKYYFGLEFEISQKKEQDILKKHYQLQMRRLRKHIPYCNLQKINKQHCLVHTNEIIKYSSKNQLAIAPELSKSSQITIPQKIQKSTKLINQIKHMKSSVKQLKQYYCKTPEPKQLVHSVQNTEICCNNNNINYTHNFNNKNNNNNNQSKKIFQIYFNQNNQKQLKKSNYSGNDQVLYSNNKKISVKLTDLENNKNKFKQIKNYIEKIEGKNSKSKIQELRYQQYIALVNSKSTYLKDFINVLEDTSAQSDPPNIAAVVHKSPNKREINQLEYPISVNESYSQNEAELLMQKAQQSIKNSLKLIQKVKKIS